MPAATCSRPAGCPKWLARSAQSLAYSSAVELERTGTDGGAAPSLSDVATRTAAAGDEPAIAFHAGEHLDFLLVSDQAPAPEALRISPLRLIGVALGPALSLVGILYLAAVADMLRAAGRV